MGASFPPQGAVPPRGASPQGAVSAKAGVLLDAPSGSRTASTVAGAVLELCKPGITRLVLVTTACGVLAAPAPVVWTDLFATIIGTALVVAGANSLNMFLERESDALMTRTRTRPLPTGRLLPEETLVFGVVVSILGLAVLAHSVASAAVGLAFLALISYVLVYTPLKRVSSLALYVGAVPGALPPAIGYAAVTGTLDGAGLWLFLILFVWQLPHFLAISIFRRDEYTRAGIAVLPAERGVPFTRVTAFALSLLLLAVTVAPYFLGLASLAYLVIASLAGLAFSLVAARGLLPGADDRWARKFFFSSMPHLVLVFGAFVSLLV